MSGLRVVLVEPQIPANLGFIARVLDNFGVSDWTAVRGCPVAGTEAERTGAPARATLDALQRSDSLSATLADRTHIVGLTARAGYRRAPLPLRELPDLAAEWGPDARVALLFGREDRGLEALETEQCTALATIPTAGLSSLNLSHAVAVTLYEWFRDRPEAAASTAEAPHQEQRWARTEDKIRFAKDAFATLERHAFRHHGDELRGAIRRLLARSIEGRDLRELFRILDHVAWRERNGTARPDDPRNDDAPDD